jgi:hypothetical protein
LLLPVGRIVLLEFVIRHRHFGYEANNFKLFADGTHRYTSEMKRIAAFVICALLPAFLEAHHGPGMRGYNPDKTIVIHGVITQCFECSNGSKGHGVVSILVDSIVWEATLPDTPSLRKAKISLSKLKKGTAVTVLGYPNTSASAFFAHKIYAREIVSNGVTILSYDDRR